MKRRTLLALFQGILERIPNEAQHRLAYGSDQNQFGDLRLPEGKGPFPLVINIHGGFWQAAYNLDHNGHLCEALAKKGIATWSIEYRRVGNPGGGYPGTFDDVRAAASFVQELKYPLDLQRTIVMGHSAGGQLALWLAGEFKWIKGAISLAGVVDLPRAAELKLGNGAVQALMGEEHYKEFLPILNKPAILIHGEDDKIVPKELSENYVKAAEKAKLVLVPGGHFELIDPETPQWATVEKLVIELVKR